MPAIRSPLGGAWVFRTTPATGRWAYSRVISYWALPPRRTGRTACRGRTGKLTVNYVPGQIEVL